MKEPLYGSGFFGPQVLGAPGEQARFFAFDARRNYL